MVKPYPDPPGMFDRGQGIGGMFGSVGRAANPYSNRLMLAGMGMLSGKNSSEGWEGAMKGLVAGSAMDTERKRERTLQGLMNDPESTLFSGMSEKERAAIASDPELARAAIAARMKPANTSDVYDNYKIAQSQGYPGTFFDYQKELKGGITVNTGDYKVPTNYRPVDPKDPSAGVEPIPGGPAEQLPAELAARIGLADSFLQEAPAIRERIAAGEGTGLWDRAQAGLNSSSTQAETRRKILSGVDAMKRMLSGAGLPVAEQAEYEARYLPTYTDDAASAAAKLDQLAMELKRVKEVVMRGRGATGASDDEEGWTTLPDGRRIREVP